MAYSAKVIKDSLSPCGVRLTTMEVTMPRIILAEFNTHRVFSRNSASSRAIPVKKRIEAVESDPFIPTAFGKNCKGMQANVDLDGDDAKRAAEVWMTACKAAVEHARTLSELGVHKQLANRLIEPYSWQTVIVTSTEWSNFFGLRCNLDAQPEIKVPAEMMETALDSSTPTELHAGDWHLPYVDDDEIDHIMGIEHENDFPNGPNVLRLVSSARCARISYLTHDGRRDYVEDVSLAKRLLSSGHMSPFEHVAEALAPFYAASTFYGNFRGWMQFRKMIKNESDFRKRSLGDVTYVRTDKQ